MGFKKISIEKYVELHLTNNPSENKNDLEKRLKSAMNDYKMELSVHVEMIFG